MTREDLIKGLRGCLSATEKFGEYAYPLILEKPKSRALLVDSLRNTSLNNR
jgi:hypothetical protein